MRVLLIEDDAATAKSIELMLGHEGFNVYKTEYGEEGLDLGKLYDYDIIILDLNLPDMHGYDVLKKLRAAKVSTPILILSGMGEPDKKVKGLGFGADDYLTKPFALEELMARLRSILRRPALAPSQTIRVGLLDFDLQHRAAGVAGRPLELPRRELLVLESLIRRAGRPVSRERLETAVYGYDEDVLPSAIDPHVSRLRRKLAEAGAGVEIRGIRGIGYLLRVLP